jgi:hypothetical protein
VVVDHLDLLCVAILPHEADPILIIDPDAVLPTPIAGESLQVVPRERPQVVQSLRCVHLDQLALSHPSDAPKPSRRATLEQRLGLSIAEGPDHLLIV